MPRKLSTKPRKMPSQTRSQATVDAILRATARVLVKDGYEGTTTNRIAEMAGISIGSLYQYFPNKEALVAALLEQHCEAMWAIIESKTAEIADCSIEIAARELIRIEFEAHAVDPKLHKVLFEQVPRIGKLEKTRDVTGRAAELVARYLEPRRDQIRPRDPKLAAFVIVHAVEAMAHAAMFQRPEYLEDDRLLEEATALVLRYLVG